MADDWKLHEGEEGKTLRLDIYGGVLSITRLDNEKLAGKWIAQPIPAEAARKEHQDKLGEHRLEFTIPLHHVELVEDAKVEAIKMLDHALDANGHSFHRKKPVDPAAPRGPEAI